jgi:hypothetical protein
MTFKNICKYKCFPREENKTMLAVVVGIITEAFLLNLSLILHCANTNPCCYSP